MFFPPPSTNPCARSTTDDDGHGENHSAEIMGQPSTIILPIVNGGALVSNVVITLCVTTVRRRDDTSILIVWSYTYRRYCTGDDFPGPPPSIRNKSPYRGDG